MSDSVTGEKQASGLIGGLRELVAEKRTRAEQADHAACMGHFPEGHTAEANALNDFCDELSTLIDAHAATSGWREIASAPKDGTEIWGYINPHDGTGIGFQDKIRWWAAGNEWVCRGLFVDATLWQPLPAPPTSDKPTEL